MDAPVKPATAPPAWLAAGSSLIGLCCVAVLAWWALTPPATDGAGAFAPRETSPCVMDQNGYFRGELYGDIERTLDWQGDDLRCDGMFRPEGQGMRLVFDEHQNEDLPGLLFVIAIADALPGANVIEQPANVTVIDQHTGQFYNTGDAEPRCWTSFTEQLELSGTIEETWRINGQLFCLDPLTAVARGGTLRLGDISYSGLFKPAL